MLIIVNASVNKCVFSLKVIYKSVKLLHFFLHSLGFNERFITF